MVSTSSTTETTGSTTETFRPLRSVLYMPSSNERALEKAKGIACDGLILDLEDAVAPDAKASARESAAAAAGSDDYGRRTVTIRVNGIGTEWHDADLEAAAQAGPDAIVVPKDSDITSVKDLRGKSVAVTQGSSANYNLLAQLDEAGVDYQDIEVQNLQPADALAAFDAGHVDAWAIWEPFTSQAEQEADARVITTGEDVVNGYVFQVASDKALEDPAATAALKDYVARIARAQKWSDTNREAWARVWSEETGLPYRTTLAATRKRKIELVPITKEVIESEQQMADTFVDNGLLPEQFDVAPFFTDRFNRFTTGEPAKGASSEGTQG